ncbi:MULTISPECIES: nuclease A inhibitor family protein [Siphonobacter]|uniref:Nuclease n=1 Tax=Siphonobacter curvatus TaxID=2094562 RepID=A0A2S7IQF9_9BACT|nr:MULTISPECIES: nuclease A inhibitor family protein [Siphonobacter]PMD98804.1 nuclease [Siphonobacter sp. BAB-5405]PQA59953.1 nuclease [Siphonobacter curvatus]
MAARLASNLLIENLKQEVNGLLYTSESDAPFEVNALPEWQEETPPEAEAFRTLLGLEADVPVKIQKIESFFRPLLKTYDWFGEEENQTVERYQQLKSFVATQLTKPQVYRVGEVEIDIYIVGQSVDGPWVSLKTKATETE